MKASRKPKTAAKRTSPKPDTQDVESTRAEGPPARTIEIRGARTHNLKNVDLDIPRGKLTVITGVSGSGKSSLAFDTLFAEGQRQYMESLSSYARQFLDQLERPDVDSIRGLQPALCIDQQQGTVSPRSTVGTVTEIYDYLRLLMARVATPACHQCGSPIERQSISQIANAIQALPVGSKLTIAAPMVIGRKGAHADILDRIAKAGLLRVRIDGQLYELEDLPVLAVRKEHSISAIVDRIVVREDSRERIDQAIAVSIRLSNGLVEAESVQPNSDTATQKLYSTRFACLACGTSLMEIEPRTFSFNSQYGACEDCQGFGYETDKPDTVCKSCNGKRLKKESLAIRLHGCSISDITMMSIQQAIQWLSSHPLDEERSKIGEPIVREIVQRMHFLQEVGLDYLTLDRSANTLSGGELQRVRLASSIGTGLVGVCYVLDEPSVGLHPRDTDRLMESLRKLQQKGNTVVVVEHDETIMRMADLLVDIGPGAGKSGGTIVAQGPPAALSQSGDSITSQYLRGEKKMPTSRLRPIAIDHPKFQIFGINKHNLHNVSVDFPLQRLVAVTGVSGSGKSTLVHDSLSESIRKTLAGEPIPEYVSRVLGANQIDKIIEVDQAPIGRSPRSIPATFCNFWDEIRKVYAKTRDAKQRGFNAARFSFNTGPGRCEACGGQGRQKLEMSFLADVYVACTQCRTKRFNRATLAVKFKGKTIADCLDMSISEASEFFDAFPKISTPLRCLEKVGLGYIAVGQPSTTLSGGEAQRIKLANELAKTDTGNTLYLLDEPTTGLHIDDVVRLIDVLQNLVDKGNTVLVVEHHMDLVRCADWIIDMGPGGGEAGGKLIGAGSPLDFIARQDTPTSIALQSPKI